MMRPSSVLTVVASFALAAVTASAQSNWDKTYNITGRSALQVSVENASVVVRSCGTCRTTHIHVDARDGDLSHWRITEMQGGNVVHFDLKHRESESFFMGWHGRSPEVTVEVPTESDVELHSGNGSLQLTGVHGSMDVKTGNGAIQLNDVKGGLRVSSGNGAINVRRAEGTLNASSGNGELTAEGRLSQFEVGSGNGSVTVDLEPGTVLSSSSRATSGHGSITVSATRDLKADVDLSTGHGSVHCDLPLLSQTSRDRHIEGSVNGGGPSLRLNSGSGSVTLRSR
jgi:hypothetical protein